MLTLGKLIIQRNSSSLSLLNLSTLSRSQQHHTPTRRNPTTAYYDDLITEAGQARDFLRLRDLLIDRINQKYFNSKDTFNFISKTHSSLSTLNQLFDCLASLPPGNPRRSAFECFVKRLCIIGLFDDALNVLDEMSKRELELNSYTYHPLMLTLAKKDDMGKAITVLGRMTKNGIDPDTTTYNSFLMMYCMKKDVDNMITVLGKMMKEKGMKGDARTYDAMVLGACKVGKVEGAVSIIWAAVEDGVTLMHCTYEHVIRGLLETEFYELGLKFVLCFAGKLQKLDDINFNVLANALIERKRFEEAKMVVDEMKNRGVSMRGKVEDN